MPCSQGIPNGELPLFISRVATAFAPIFTLIFATAHIALVVIPHAFTFFFTSTLARILTDIASILAFFRAVGGVRGEGRQQQGGGKQRQDYFFHCRNLKYKNKSRKVIIVVRNLM